MFGETQFYAVVDCCCGYGGYGGYGQRCLGERAFTKDVRVGLRGGCALTRVSLKCESGIGSRWLGGSRRSGAEGVGSFCSIFPDLLVLWDRNDVSA